MLEKLLSKIVSEQTIRDAVVKALEDKRVEWITKEALQQEIHGLKETLEELKLKKKIEERDIESMVKIKDEKNKIELEKEKIRLIREYQEKEMVLTKEGHEKVMNMLENGKKDLQEIYGKIIDRLPNVNMEIKKRG